MPEWLSFSIDGRSFFLGVIAGFLLWLVFGQVKKAFPQGQEIARRWFNDLREKNFAGVEAGFRLAALRAAQKSHLAAPLFSLDEVVIFPRLMAPPPILDPTQTNPPDAMIASAFPYLPDWPELASQYPIERISLAQALQLGANLVVVGQPGAGKTVALAHLATQMARQSPDLDNLQNIVPVFVHIQDILAQHNPTSGDPLATLTKAIAPKLPILLQSQAASFVKGSLVLGGALLLIDGLDELPESTLKEAVEFLGNLLKANPKVRIVTTGSPAFLDGLLALNFYPVALAAWDYNDRLQFIEQWGKQWNEHIAPEIKHKAQWETLDPLFVNNWINRNQIHLTPLEWTLNLWAVYAGESGAITSPMNSLEQFITRYIPDMALLESTQKLAFFLVKNRKANFIQEDLDAYFSAQKATPVQIYDPEAAPDEAQPPEDAKKAKSTRKKKQDKTPASPWISSLMQTGLVSEHPGHLYRFAHPAITAYLAATSLSETDVNEWLAAPDAQSWDTLQLAVGYYCGLNSAKLTLPNDWIQGTSPLFQKPLAVGRWLKFIPPNLPIRSKVLKRLADGVLDEGLLYATRLRLSSALLNSNDPSISAMFKQLLAYPKARVRAMACVALGALQENKTINQLAALLADPDENVRRDACIALGSLQDPTVINLLSDCLAANDELLRQVSAESLAGDVQRGHEILKHLLKSENLLVRRSVVFGLARIRAPWCKTMLEEVAVQDGQWVVRNAAGEALETIQKPSLRVPSPLSGPSETGWVLTYASKLGVGVPPGDPAQEILVHALKSGSPEEKTAALGYLRGYSDETVSSIILQTAASAPHPVVSDAAQLALWYMSCRGIAAEAPKTATTRAALH